MTHCTPQRRQAGKLLRRLKLGKAMPNDKAETCSITRIIGAFSNGAHLWGLSKRAGTSQVTSDVKQEPILALMQQQRQQEEVDEEEEKKKAEQEQKQQEREDDEHKLQQEYVQGLGLLPSTVHALADPKKPMVDAESCVEKVLLDFECRVPQMCTTWSELQKQQDQQLQQQTQLHQSQNPAVSSQDVQPEAHLGGRVLWELLAMRQLIPDIVSCTPDARSGFSNAHSSIQQHRAHLVSRACSPIVMEARAHGTMQRARKLVVAAAAAPTRHLLSSTSGPTTASHQHNSGAAPTTIGARKMPRWTPAGASPSRPPSCAARKTVLPTVKATQSRMMSVSLQPPRSSRHPSTVGVTSAAHRQHADRDRAAAFTTNMAAKVGVSAPAAAASGARATVSTAAARSTRATPSPRQQLSVQHPGALSQPRGPHYSTGLPQSRVVLCGRRPQPAQAARLMQEEAAPQSAACQQNAAGVPPGVSAQQLQTETAVQRSSPGSYAARLRGNKAAAGAQQSKEDARMLDINMAAERLQVADPPIKQRALYTSQPCGSSAGNASGYVASQQALGCTKLPREMQLSKRTMAPNRAMDKAPGWKAEFGATALANGNTPARVTPDMVQLGALRALAILRRPVSTTAAAAAARANASPAAAAAAPTPLLLSPAAEPVLARMRALPAPLREQVLQRLMQRAVSAHEPGVASSHLDALRKALS